jgi:predicted ABC-type ATPase
MFAGPNGSGKSTIKNAVEAVIGPESLGVYINPDEIEKEIGHSRQRARRKE